MNDLLRLYASQTPDTLREELIVLTVPEVDDAARIDGVGYPSICP